MILTMLLAIILGVIGYLAAIFLTIIAGEIIIKIVNKETFINLLYLLIACGVLRGFYVMVNSGVIILLLLNYWQ